MPELCPECGTEKLSHPVTHVVDGEKIEGEILFCALGCQSGLSTDQLSSGQAS